MNQQYFPTNEYSATRSHAFVCKHTHTCTGRYTFSCFRPREERTHKAFVAAFCPPSCFAVVVVVVVQTFLFATPLSTAQFRPPNTHIHNRLAGLCVRTTCVPCVYTQTEKHTAVFLRVGRANTLTHSHTLSLPARAQERQSTEQTLLPQAVYCITRWLRFGYRSTEHAEHVSDF